MKEDEDHAQDKAMYYHYEQKTYLSQSKQGRGGASGYGISLDAHM